MAEKTPIKAVNDPKTKICRACYQITDHPVSLFDQHNKKKEIAKFLEKIIENDEVNPNDGLPHWVCRSCSRKLEVFNHFTSICKTSQEKLRSNNAADSRFKRGKKNEESPSAGKESPQIMRVNKKTRQLSSLNPPVKTSLSTRFISETNTSRLTPIVPKPKRLQSTARPISSPDNYVVKHFISSEDNDSHRLRKLPGSLNPKLQEEKQTDTDLQRGIEILSSSGLWINTLVTAEPSGASELLSFEEREKIIRMVSLSCAPHTIAEAVMDVPVIQNCIKSIFLQGVNDQCKKLCAIKQNPSVLRVSTVQQKQLYRFKWITILNEIKERAPDVLDFLMAVAAPDVKTDGSQIPRLCTAYAVLMNTRNRELSLVQKINAITLGAGHATKKTFERLNKAGLVQSRNSFLGIMDAIGDVIHEVCQVLNSDTKSSLRLVFDNLDFKVLVNIVLKNHRNSDMHWIGHYATFERVSSDHLNDTEPIVADLTTFDNINYLLTKDELNKLKSDFTVLVARVLVEFFQCLKHLSSAVTAHIQHRYSKEMATKSKIIGLPVVPYNQNKQADVCQYLQYLEDFLLQVFTPEDHPIPEEAPAEEIEKHREHILGNTKVPLCGDLLGRERVTGAKKTRLGCDNSSDRFNNIVENPALWHAKQSFLVYIWEQLYKADATSGREIGTLYHLRQQWRMTNVYSKVKKNYKSAENLMLCATKAYICCAFMAWAGLDDLDGTPKNISIIDKNASEGEMQAFITETVGKFVEEYVLVEHNVEKAWREQQQQKTKAAQQMQETATTCTSSSTAPLPNLPAGQIVVLVQPKQGSGTYNVLGVGTVCNTRNAEHLSGVPILVAAVEPPAAGVLSVGQIVMWPRMHLAIPTTSTKDKDSQHDKKLPSPMSDIPPTVNSEDRVLNYALQTIQLGVMLMQLNDTEKEGDGDRSIINWKLLMLYFRSRSRGMKYAFEAMRLLTCVKALYSERMAHRIIHGQFVNIKGGKGNNCANDLKMEMLNKHYKVVLRGMCGNKTIKAVERSSAAAYGLNKILKSYDCASNVPPDSTSHTHKSTHDDIREMVVLLNGIKPFEHQSGRMHRSFPTTSRSPLDQLDVTQLYNWLSSHKRRLFRDHYANCNDGEEESDSEEDNDEDLESDMEDDQ